MKSVSLSSQILTNAQNCVFFFCIFVFHCLRPDFLLPHFQLNKYVFITTMCHLLIPNRSSTEFIKSFQITPVFTHLRPLFPVFSIATLLDSLLLPHGQLSNLHTLSLFFLSAPLWGKYYNSHSTNDEPEAQSPHNT